MRELLIRFLAWRERRAILDLTVRIARATGQLHDTDSIADLLRQARAEAEKSVRTRVAPSSRPGKAP